MVALAGPTGVGKSELAIALARRCDAEIVNADSRQVYRRLDIGSAKPTPAQLAAVPHHLFGVVESDEPFDCARYRRLALAAIEDIAGRGRRVVLAGGTGLYIKVLRGGLFEGPARAPELRARLEAEEDAEPGVLHRRLSEVDPTAAARLHPHDRPRLIRALEVFERSGRTISDWQAEHRFSDRELEMRTLGIDLPRAQLYARIDARCREMVEAGLIDEVRELYAAGYDPALPALQSPGYREIGEHVRGLCGLDDALERMARATRRLAKRQLTWLRGDPQLTWVEPDVDAIAAAVEGWW